MKKLRQLKKKGRIVDQQQMMITKMLKKMLMTNFKRFKRSVGITIGDIVNINKSANLFILNKFAKNTSVLKNVKIKNVQGDILEGVNGMKNREDVEEIRNVHICMEWRVITKYPKYIM